MQIAGRMERMNSRQQVIPVSYALARVEKGKVIRIDPQSRPFDLDHVKYDAFKVILRLLVAQRRFTPVQTNFGGHNGKRHARFRPHRLLSFCCPALGWMFRGIAGGDRSTDPRFSPRCPRAPPRHVPCARIVRIATYHCRYRLRTRSYYGCLCLPQDRG